MVRTQRELRTGWIVSILFHAAAAVLLFLSTFRQYIPEPQIVEMTWGSITSRQSAIPNIPTEQSSARPEAEQAEQTDNTVALPSRRYLDLPDEVISVKQNKRTVSTDLPTNTGTNGKINADERRSNVVSNGLGTRENVTGRSTGTTSQKVTTPFGSGNENGGLGENIAFAVQWAGGGNRKLMEGKPPAYPPGVNVSAQIKLRVRVQPDGSVRSVSPAQKGDTRLENAAIGRVKMWKFEPLLSAQPQIDQDCTITFNFTLQ